MRVSTPRSGGQTESKGASIKGRSDSLPGARFDVPLPLQAAVLLLLILAAYLPASRGGFVWDDEAYVTENPMLSAPDGMYKIWFSTEHLSQYFPLTYTTLRFAYQLWGLDPAGFHILNILLHCGNCVLIWMLLRKLAIPGAWLAAALFAVHPIHVETVAWISEIKTLQSTLFSLLSIWAWIKFIDESSNQRWKAYALAVFLYCLALLSKTTACTLPAALMLVSWLRRYPFNRKLVVQMTPFCLIGLGMGLFSIWWERQMGHYGKEFALSFGLADRLLIAGRAIWFYAGKVLWPVKLTFSYPHWNIDPRSPVQYIWPLAAMAAAIVLWVARRRLGARVLSGIIFFAASVSPLLGLIQIFTFRYSFVADHYVYFADLGLLALIAAAAAKTIARFKLHRTVWVISGIALITLSALTWRQCHAYQSAESLLKDTIAKNPGSWMSWANLGYSYSERGKTDDAIDCFRRAIRLNPACFEAQNNLGLALSAKGQFDDAIEQYQQALRIDPKDFTAHNNIGLALAAKGRPDDAIAEYQKALELNPAFVRARLNKAAALLQTGRTSDAAAELRSALAIAPDNLEALNDLAWLLSTSSEDSVRSGSEAVKLAEHACQILQFSSPEALLTLAAAYAEAGRYGDASTTAGKAEAMAQSAGQPKLAEKARELVTLFSSGRPLRTEPVKKLR